MLAHHGQAAPGLLSAGVKREAIAGFATGSRKQRQSLGSTRATRLVCQPPIQQDDQRSARTTLQGQSTPGKRLLDRRVSSCSENRIRHSACGVILRRNPAQKWNGECWCERGDRPVQRSEPWYPSSWCPTPRARTARTLHTPKTNDLFWSVKAVNRSSNRVRGARAFWCEISHPIVQRKGTVI